VPLLDRPALSLPDAQALLAETRQDPLLYAATSLMLFAGARPQEAAEATIADYEPGVEPRIWLGQRWVTQRQIRIAPAAAHALDEYLATQDADPEEPLLLGLQRVNTMHDLVRRAALHAGVDAGAHSLRRAAIAAAWEDGAPASHIEAYFGISKALAPEALTALPDGYDAALARTLEAAFGA
jgi:integrase